MRLSDQIELLRETLEEFGYELGEGQSVGEGAAQVIEHLEETVNLAAKPVPDAEPDDVDDDVLACWRDYWADIVAEGGRLDVNQVARELFDYRTVIGEVPLVYEEVTGGVLSKPNSAAVHVLSFYREDVDRMVKQAVEDAKEEWADEQPSTDGLCDSCTYLKDAALPRLCVNREAWRQGFSRRGYSQKAGHGCELWAGK